MSVPLTHFDYSLGNKPDLIATLEGMAEDTTGILYNKIRRVIGPSAAHLFACMSDYMVSGKQTFALGPHAQDMFAHTSLQGVTLDMLKLPYPCLYVAVKDCPWTIWGGRETEYHRVAGFYVREMPQHIQILIWGMENEKSKSIGDDATFWFSLSFKELAGYMNDRGEVDLEGYLVTLLSDSDPRSLRDESDPGMRWTSGEAEGVMANQRSTAKNVLRVALNLVLYLESDKADVLEDASAVAEAAELEKKLKRTKNVKKARRAQKQLERTPKTKVTWVGNFLGRQGLPSEADRASGKVAGHIRRGHWHHYWTGPRRDAEGRAVKGQKLIRKWVPPAWVGGEVRAPERVYKLHGDDA